MQYFYQDFSKILRYIFEIFSRLILQINLFIIKRSQFFEWVTIFIRKCDTVDSLRIMNIVIITISYL